MSRQTSIINVAKMKAACVTADGTKIRVGKGFPEAFAAFAEAILQDCMRVVLNDGRMTLRPEDLPRLDVPGQPEGDEEYSDNPDPGGNGNGSEAHVE